MSLYQVVSGTTINAGDLNQLVQVLQQPSGGQEQGKYFLAGSVFQNNAIVSQYIQTLSRNATPVSVSIDTSIQAPTGGISGVSTGQLTSAGFQVFSLSSTGGNNNARAGGNFTVQF